MPESMGAVEIAEPGGPEVLRLVTRPVPVVGAGDVLIRVVAAGVNYPDVQQRRGRYRPPPGVSDLPGLEVSGTVVALGEGVDELRVGDRVCALLAGGGYAEYCVAPSRQCLPIPEGLDFVSAAAIPETYFTVWTNVFEDGGLTAGQTILVHGGTSGIGTTTIQLAAAFGARVFATAGSPEKCDACVRLGAEHAVNYRTEDFVSVLRDRTGGRGVDLILDYVGGEYVARNLDLLARRGRLVQIGFLTTREATLDLWPILLKRLTITGSLLRPRSVDEKGAIADALRTRVWPLLARGVVRPVVHATFPLADASHAHRLVETSTHIGKIVLTVSENS